VQLRLLGFLCLLQSVVEFFVFLEALEMKTVPISIPGTDTEAKRGGEVNPETFPELSGDWSDGHLVSGERKERWW